MKTPTCFFFFYCWYSDHKVKNLKKKLCEYSYFKNMTFESIRWVISSSIYIFFLKSELQARAKALNTNAIVPDYIGRYYLLDSRSKALECNNQQISRGLWGVLQTRWWCNFRPFCLSNLWQLENCSLAHI